MLMAEATILQYVIQDPVELNLSFMPFVKGGGLFIPTSTEYLLGEVVKVELQLPGKKDFLLIEGKVVWVTPSNALHHVLPGIGIQFSGLNAQNIREQIESHLDKTMEIGGYTYGMFDEGRKEK
jgi:type IV pilus assembly protein PilZ